MKPTFDAAGLDATAETGGDAALEVANDGNAIEYLDTVGLCDRGAVTVWFDDDGDGWGNTEARPRLRVCETMLPARYYATRPGDCNDRDPTVNRGAPEVCGNGRDDNCEVHVDEGCM